MRNILIFIVLLHLIVSCTGNNNNLRQDPSLAKIKKQAIRIAETYAKDQLKEAKESVAKDGIITLGDNQKSYVINPAKILIGLIDDDSNKDAIVSIDSYNGQYVVLTEQLILINTDGKLMLIKDIDTDITILGLKNRVITAEIHTRSRNSPLYNCAACKEIVKYQFRGGDLVKIQ